MDIGEWFTNIFLMVEDKDFDYVFGCGNGEWNFLLDSNLEKLQKIKQRIIAFEKNNPPHVFNYKAIYQDLDNQKIIKMSHYLNRELIRVTYTDFILKALK